MSAYEMNRLMFDAYHHPKLIDEFKLNPDSLLARYDWIIGKSIDR